MMLITRSDYQRERSNFLSSIVDLKSAVGLEIGASDLPTVGRDQGLCFHANSRTKDEMIALWSVPVADTPEVDYLVDRLGPISGSITDRIFDYIIAAHVLEHIPDPISFLQDLCKLLREGGVILLAIPDKRHTFDASREVTPIEHILNDHHQKASYPSIEHIMQCAPCIIPGLKRLGPAELYAWAKQNYESGEADVHCHVWTDADFFDQVDEIMKAGLLPGVSVARKEYNKPGFNEFRIALRVAKRS
jgi:SAM-dependent methyltransferase